MAGNVAKNFSQFNIDGKVPVSYDTQSYVMEVKILLYNIMIVTIMYII